jgi:hypothetical protein
MKVKELIEELRQYDENEICYSLVDSNYMSYEPVCEVTLVERDGKMRLEID